MKSRLFLLAALISLPSCSPKPPRLTSPDVNAKNLVLASEQPRNRIIGDDQHSFLVNATLDNGLAVGLPPEFLNAHILFGGIVIGVSDHESAALGSLKMSGTPLIHGSLKPQREEAGDFLVLEGCAGGCGETSLRQVFFHLPASTDPNGFYQVQFADAGNFLRISSINADLPERLDARWISSKTTRVDYSDGTLVLDTDETLRMDRQGKEFTLTVRWFVKLPRETDPWFKSRPQTDGIGYFTTETNTDRTWITRWSLANAGADSGSVHYFIKRVPQEWRPAFAEAFDRWNEVFKKETGRKLLDYTFIDRDDSRDELIQSGDIRYNVLEWDTVNQASYGGLGPSLASQSSGQMIWASVLVQGPKIIKKYRAWFGLRDAISDASRHGDLELADRLLLSQRRADGTDDHAATGITISSKAGAWRSPASDPRLKDPIGEPRDDFELIPDGQSFETYMHGYFLELVGHELGHNLGLRHNFYGNIFAEGDAPSSSVMEYLGRPWRYKNRVSPYDIAAIKYGYNGDLPESTNQFCTDENVLIPEDEFTSPECLRDDATRDPYSHFLLQLDRSIDYLVNRGRPTAPEWTIEDVESPLASALLAISGYAARAESQSATWHAWHRQPSRPTDPERISAGVLRDLSERICSDRVLLAEAGKATAEAREKTRKNVDDLLNRGQRMLDAFKLPAVLNCQH